MIVPIVIVSVTVSPLAFPSCRHPSKCFNGGSTLCSADAHLLHRSEARLCPDKLEHKHLRCCTSFSTFKEAIGLASGRICRMPMTCSDQTRLDSSSSPRSV